MEKTLRCRDGGIDCDFLARTETEEEILKKVADHCATEHDMKEIPEAVIVRKHSS